MITRIVAFLRDDRVQTTYQIVQNSAQLVISTPLFLLALLLFWWLL
jgi:hypothetical protein